MNIIQPSKCIAAKMSSYQITKRAITVTIKNISKIDSADMIILTILLQSHLVAHIIRINCKPRIPAPLMKDSVFKKYIYIYEKNMETHIGGKWAKMET